jgi:hypothetical protein
MAVIAIIQAIMMAISRDKKEEEEADEAQA